MRRWTVVAAAALAAVGMILAPTGAASGERKHKCSFNLTTLDARVKVISGNPPLDGTSLSAATIDGKLCGKPFHGAARLIRTTVSTDKLSVKYTNFGPLGSFRGTFSGSRTVNPDGTSSFTGNGKITSGTGLYNGATGSFTASGAKPSGTSPSALTFKGTLKH
jgi:hypothetical protein